MTSIHGDIAETRGSARRRRQGGGGDGGVEAPLLGAGDQQADGQQVVAVELEVAPVPGGDELAAGVEVGGERGVVERRRARSPRPRGCDRTTAPARPRTSARRRRATAAPRRVRRAARLRRRNAGCSRRQEPHQRGGRRRLGFARPGQRHRRDVEVPVDERDVEGTGQHAVARHVGGAPGRARLGVDALVLGGQGTGEVVGELPPATRAGRLERDGRCSCNRHVLVPSRVCQSSWTWRVASMSASAAHSDRSIASSTARPWRSCSSMSASEPLISSSSEISRSPDGVVGSTP